MQDRCTAEATNKNKFRPRAVLVLVVVYKYSSSIRSRVEFGSSQEAVGIRRHQWGSELGVPKSPINFENPISSPPRQALVWAEGSKDGSRNVGDRCRI